MNSAEKSNDRKITVGAIAVIALAFAASVAYRYRFLADENLVGIHQFLLSHSTVIAENWHRSGFFGAHGLLYWYAKSMEYATPLSQNVYPSFPAGGFVLPYFISWIFSIEITPWLFQVYALLNQFLIGVTIFVIARQLTATMVSRPFERAVFCVLPAITVFFTSGYMWHFGSTWFGEQAGVLPFILTVLGDVLAVRASETENKVEYRRARLFSFAAVMFGTYCDPAFFIGISIVRFVLKTAIRTEKQRGIWSILAECFVPFAIAVGLHFFQVLSLFGVERLVALVRHAFEHISPSDRPITLGMLFHEYAVQHLYLAYGRFRYFLPLVIFLTLLSIAMRQQPRERRVALIMLLGPPLLHVLVWRKHALVHNFNTVRFDPFVAIATFCIVPLYLYEILKKRTSLTRLAVFGTLFLVLNIWQWKVVYRSAFIAVVDTHKKPQLVERAKLIGKNFGEKDLLMSPDFTIHAHNDINLMVYSKRVVHMTESRSEMIAKIKQYPQARPVILSTQSRQIMGCNEVNKLSEDLYYCFPKL